MMKRSLTVYEHQPLTIGTQFDPATRTISRQQAHQLQQSERTHGKRVFDWGYNTVTPRQYVGVVDVPSLHIEILPKLDRDATAEHGLVRDNIQYMLRTTGLVPFRERDIASLRTATANFLDLYIAAFLRKLREALQGGVLHQYVATESQEPYLRGKLLVAEQIRRNSTHRDRFAIHYDTFSADNRVNRALAATLQKLVGVTRSARLLRDIRALLTHPFAAVDVAGFRREEFDRIHLSRLHDRYRSVLDIARLFWQAEGPTPHSGDMPAFSLLFDMNHLFERFIRQLLLDHPQAVLGEGREVRRLPSRPLFRRQDGREVLSLRPDLVICDTQTDQPVLIVDTKWKWLAPAGPAQSDLYQMYAYAREYACPRVVLLYPASVAQPPVTPQFYNDSYRGSPVEVATVALSLREPLPNRLPALLAELRAGLRLFSKKVANP